MTRGFCGIGVVHSKSTQNIGTLWRSAHCFNVDFIFTVARRYTVQCSDTIKAHRHIPLFHFDDISDLVKHLPFGCRLVGIELSDKAKPIQHFSHPEQACYVLGAEDYGLSDKEMALCHDLIVIPGLPQCLNVSVAGSIVLYDRARKACDEP